MRPYLTASLALCWLAAPALASTLTFDLGTATPGPVNTAGSPNPAVFSSSPAGSTISASAYNCGYPSTLCPNNANTSYSASPTQMYDNADGLGIYNNPITINSFTEYEIPNSEFIQIDFSQVIAKIGAANLTDIRFTMTDVIDSWSLYTSSTAGTLEGAGGAQIYNNSAPPPASNTNTGVVTAAQLGSNRLLSFVAGNCCADAVIENVSVDYTSSVPEPATGAPMALALLGAAFLCARARRIRSNPGND